MACAIVRQNGKEYPATSATFSEGRLALSFGAAGAEAVLKVEPRSSWIRLTVESVKGAEIESLVFLNVPLTLQGRPEESFGACALSMNLITRVDQLPALQSELRAAAHRKFGIAGAKVALVGMPPGRMLAALKEVLAIGYLTHFDWGCKDGEHTGWAILEAGSKAEDQLLGQRAPDGRRAGSNAWFSGALAGSSFGIASSAPGSATPTASQRLMR